MLPMAVARSYLVGVVIRLRTSGLWMTPCLQFAHNGQAQATPVGREFKVTHQAAALGTKSDVYNCPVE